MKPVHPMQPLVNDTDATLRFHANELVKYCVMRIGLNELARMPFSPADWGQVAQLLGYSLDGFRELSYVSDYDKGRAELLDFPCECCGEPAGEGGALCPACQESR